MPTRNGAVRARPRQSGGSQRVLAYQKVTVPYFDLALYGLEDYNSEAAVPAVFRFHPYTFGRAAASDLPVLRHASGGLHPQPGAGRLLQRGVMHLVLFRRQIHLHQ